MNAFVVWRVLIHAMTAVPKKLGDGARRTRPSTPPSDSAPDASGAGAPVLHGLEDAEAVLAAGRMTGLVSREEYHARMRQLADVDEMRHPLRIPDAPGRGA